MNTQGFKKVKELYYDLSLQVSVTWIFYENMDKLEDVQKRKGGGGRDD